YGTLIDIHTDEEDKRFWNKVAKKVAKYHFYTPEDLKNNYKKLCEEKQQYIEEIEILDVFEELLNITREKSEEVAWMFRKASTQYIRLYKGVKQLLKKLKSEGYSLYVLSNAQEAFTMPELKKLGIMHYFDGIAISSKYGVKKPNLEFFQRAIKNFNAKGEIWMVGNDAECDIYPAEKLGLNTIFIESNLTFNKIRKPDFIGFSYKKIYLKILNRY
ncbi:MAG: HAD family hydrolase, partial [Anaeroplasmataceae bacterium]|nr:HAD family hydrolase [Anaeroplasmataceae bacterium]